ncbi:MAG: CHASE2 domain-containing protein, partial [Cyanobacteria bacterium P01_A01_bin.17]
MADQFVVLKFEQGSFEQGFMLTLQVGLEGSRPSTEIAGSLPPAEHLRQHYQAWQSVYWQLGVPSRIEPVTDQVTNVSRLKDCLQAAAVLRQSMNDWLCVAVFRPIREKLLEQLSPCDRIRILLQTDDLQLQKLPWHTWDLLERYPLTEIALAAPTYANPPLRSHSPGDVRILAILGNSSGIDVSADQALLEQLPNAHIYFLDEPNRHQLNEQLWQQNWDILFFAGHSCSQGATSGTLCLNAEERLEIEDLRYALKQAVGNGLQLAILNSCDGLGLGRALADLQIPQLIVMREPVPDAVAQDFLKYFLQSYAKGTALYLAMREARERLQGLEQTYPCATWLPVICQNPAVVPPTWLELSSPVQADPPIALPTAQAATSLPCPLPHRRQSGFLVMQISLLMTALVFAGRWVGWLQFPELWALDRLLQIRPLEAPDSRLLVITVSEAEIQAQGEDSRRSSLSDATLSQLLEKLVPAQPRVIGLDVYRDFPVRPDQPRLRKQLQETQGLVGVCKNLDTSSDPTGIAPPPEISMDRMGFSDFIADPDGVLRRQLLYLTPEPASPCTTPHAFSSLLAFHYLSHLKIQPTFTAQNQLKLGAVTLPTLRPHTGGYQTVDTHGIQIPLNYR